MDAVTAGIALIAVQLCAGLVMAGTYCTVPEDRCTRYWAVSGVLVSLGVLVIVVNSGAFNYPLLVIGNNGLAAGAIAQWWGVQIFHGKQPSRWGWGLLGGFAALYGLLLIQHASVLDRAALSAAIMLTTQLLCLRELWPGGRYRSSFARILAVGASLLLIVNMAVRTLGCLLRLADFSPLPTSLIGVVFVYIVPLAGILLFNVALLLLYFERLVQAKHHLATHDELTGLLNRRAVIAAGEREIVLAARLQLPLAVAYVDVDHFKQINDALGHEHGDSVLVEIGRILKLACRETDWVGRYGGEEFCVICPGIGEEEVDAFGRRLLHAVREHRFEANIAVTVSIGFAVLSPDAQHRTWTVLMHDADSALYQAKKCGRNTYRIYQETTMTAAPSFGDATGVAQDIRTDASSL